MKLKAWNGLELVDIQPPDLKNHCREGVYICCLNHNHNGGDCGYHLWVWCKPDPIPHHNILLNAIKKDVPHVNGNGAHAF
jgi:hypothetical protein